MVLNMWTPAPSKLRTLVVSMTGLLVVALGRIAEAASVRRAGNSPPTTRQQAQSRRTGGTRVADSSDGFQVELLGPVEAWVDGRPVAFRGQRPRALFALPALMGGRVVTVDRLIDELWC